jgi:hypothetical protein
MPLTDDEHKKSPLISVSTQELADAMEESRHNVTFLTENDMDQFKAAVYLEAREVLLSRNRWFKLIYDNKGRVFIGPVVGFTPCGSFHIAELIGNSSC